MKADIETIDSIWIQVIRAMLHECKWMLNGDETEREYKNIMSELEKEFQRRNLMPIMIESDVSNPSQTIFGRREPRISSPSTLTKGTTDNQARIFYALGAEIADFSCLGKGVRKYVEAIWLDFEKELETRDIEPEHFCDLEI